MVVESRKEASKIKTGKINKARYYLPTRQIFNPLKISPTTRFPSRISVIRMLDKIGAKNIAKPIIPISKSSMNSPRKNFGPTIKKAGSQGIAKTTRKKIPTGCS
jgi:hypothetical protein